MEWACGDGLSTTYRRFQMTDWEDDLNVQLFDQYSTAILELEKRRRELEEVEESGSLLFPNTKTTSKSYTIAPIVARRVDDSMSKDSETTPTKGTTTEIARSGSKVKRAFFPKASSQSRKRRASTSDEDEDIVPKTFKNYIKEKQMTIQESQVSV
ncbi:unnamed protein product [Parnassius apollo]|uniref:(apollo) hypothetical protein n=1 Tax=Parnassius apollo TaxID=110799 RepID=A0A8S3X9C6_PARAO|nr:unnamed protein product [Parnassius apollo]